MIPGRANRIILVWVFATPIVFALLLFSWRATWLPKPQQASRTQLLHWLATRDLAQCEDEVKVTLLKRLGEEYLAPESHAIGQKRLAAAYFRLHPRQRALWRKNLLVLSHVWVRNHTHFWATYPKHRHEGMVQAVDEGLRLYAVIRNSMGDEALSWESNTSARIGSEPMPRPLPPHFDALALESLHRWMTQADVHSLAPASQRELAKLYWHAWQNCSDGKQEEIRDRLKEDSKLTSDSRRRGLVNSHRLLAIWFLSQAKHWEKLSASHRVSKELQVSQAIREWHGNLAIQFTALEPSESDDRNALEDLEKLLQQTKWKQSDHELASAQRLLRRIQERMSRSRGID